MKFIAVVVGVHSAEVFTDGRQRATLQIKGADAMFREIRVVNENEWVLDQKLEVYIHETTEDMDKKIAALEPKPEVEESLLPRVEQRGGTSAV